MSYQRLIKLLEKDGDGNFYITKKQDENVIVKPQPVRKQITKEVKIKNWGGSIDSLRTINSPMKIKENVKITPKKIDIPKRKRDVIWLE